MKTHMFEQQGLGLAPFRCVAIIDSGPGNKKSCDHCGAGIRYAFEVVSRDGKSFNVGSDCALKTDDSGLRATVNRHLNALRRTQRYQRAVKPLLALLAQEDVRTRLAALPNPRGEHGRGNTALDFCTQVANDDRLFERVYKEAVAIARKAAL